MGQRLLYLISYWCATSPELAPRLEKVCFHSGPHDYDYVYKVVQCLLGVFYRHAGMTFLYVFFLDSLVL